VARAAYLAISVRSKTLKYSVLDCSKISLGLGRVILSYVIHIGGRRMAGVLDALEGRDDIFYMTRTVLGVYSETDCSLLVFPVCLAAVPSSTLDHLAGAPFPSLQSI
jgi:hypothetical protein